MHDRQHAPLRIGALAAACGLTPDALRYYERLGLLPKPARSNGGFRLYPRTTLARLRFIRQAQQMGLALREIRVLLSPATGRRREQCEGVREVLAGHLSGVEARLAELRAFRRTLQRAVGECDRALRASEPTSCPVIDTLERAKEASGSAPPDASRKR